MPNLDDLELYVTHQNRLPQNGKHIIGSYTKDYIIVYQAYNPQIAKFAVENQKFGGDHYSFGRMTWIKPGFMWMMYRSGWAQKENQEHILAIRLKMDGFMEILRNATHSTFKPNIYQSTEEWQNQLKTHQVRLQWDPDHSPKGGKLERKAIQLGLKGEMLQQFNNEWILAITDITGFVKKQYINMQNSINILEIPIENVLDLDDELLVKRIGITKA